MNHYGTVPPNLPPLPTQESWYELLRLWRALQCGDGWDTDDILGALDRAFTPLNLSPEAIPDTVEEIAEAQREAEQTAARAAAAEAEAAERAAFLAAMTPEERAEYQAKRARELRYYLDGLNIRDVT